MIELLLNIYLSYKIVNFSGGHNRATIQVHLECLDTTALSGSHTEPETQRRAMSLKLEHIVFYVCTRTGGIIRRQQRDAVQIPAAPSALF